MATWTSDVMGLARHMPTPVEKRRARLIAKRWAMWEPVLIYELRKQKLSVIAELPRLRQTHAAVMSGLLNSGVPLRAIRHNRSVMLDDPRIDDETRDGLVAEFHRASGAQGRKHAVK